MSRIRIGLVALAAVVATSSFNVAAAATPRLVRSDQLMWVPGVLAGKLHGVNPNTGRTERTLPGNSNPMIAAPSPDGQTLYVVNLPKAGKASGVSIIDVASGTSTFIKLTGVAAAEVLDNGGRYLYVADIVAHQVVKIDTATKAIVKRFAFKDHLTDEPLGIEISPDNKTLYIAWLAGWLQAYDSTTGAPLRTIKLPESKALDIGTLGQFTLPGWVVLSPDGRRLYALNFATGDTNVWDTETWTDIGTIHHGNGLTLTILASFSPDGSKIYFTNYGTRSLQVVDTATLQEIKSIRLSGRPIGVATQDDGTVQVGVINSSFNAIDAITPIGALVVVSMLTPLQNVNLGVGRILRFRGSDQQLLSSTAIGDTVPGAFVAPPPAEAPAP